MINMTYKEFMSESTGSGRYLEHSLNPTAREMWKMIQSSKHAAIRYILDFGESNKENTLYVWDAYKYTHEQFLTAMKISRNFSSGLISTKRDGDPKTEAILDIGAQSEKHPTIQEFTRLYQNQIF